MAKPKDPAKVIEALTKENNKLKADLAKVPKPGITLIEDQTSLFVFDEFELHPAVHGWFTGSKVKATERHDKFTKALNIGMLALWQGRVAHALNTFKDELQSEIELVQMYADSLQERLEKDNKYKTDQESTVADALEAYIKEKKYSDTVEVTGTAGTDGGNKTGDVLAMVKDGRDSENLGIEIKFTEKYGLGDTTANSNDGGRKKGKTNYRAVGDNAVSQLIETRANRNSKYAIFVIDQHLNPLKGPPVQYFPAYSGFIVSVDSLSNDFSSLEICYEIARKMTLSSRKIVDNEFAVLEYLLKDLAFVLNRQDYLKDAGKTIIKQITKSHKDNMKVVTEQISVFDAELTAMKTSIDNTMSILDNFFSNGEISANDMFLNYIRDQESKQWASVKADTAEWAKKVEARAAAEAEEE